MARGLLMHGFRTISRCRIRTQSRFILPPIDLIRFTDIRTVCPSSFYSTLLPRVHHQNTVQQSWKRSTSTDSSVESSLPQLDVNKEVDAINRYFAEAREEIELALESKESVYFNEEAECARDAVQKVLLMYKELLGKLNEEEKGSVQRSMGLKIEQLKAEAASLVE